ncbi:hypothetical protein AB0368_15865 [Actinoplanes sp. NPDC051475]|uniref:hypothetical protein n=1 Tax=Actinoplanes sp. NPDC051475 TaxID=3157225 RepID=UPI00344F2345
MVQPDGSDGLASKLAELNSIIHYLRNSNLTPSQRDLLTTDFAARSKTVPEDLLAPLNSEVIRLHVPHSAGPQESPLTESVAHAQKEQADVGVLTVLPVEHRAVLAAFGIDPSEFDVGEQGRRYHRTLLPSRRLGRDVSVVVALAEGAYDARMIDAVYKVDAKYSVAFMALVGIGAGHPDSFKLGDVAIPRVVWNYEAVRLEESGAAPRPRHENMLRDVAINLNYYDPDVSQFYSYLAEHISRLGPTSCPAGFDADAFRPTVKSQNVATAVGARLIADGTTMDALRDQNQLSSVADQESYGFAHACRDRWWAVFRGISDFGDPSKSSDWQFLAASSAALCLRDFIESEFIPPNER